MQKFRGGVSLIGGKKVIKTMDYLYGLDGLPKSDVLKFVLADDCSVVIRPSGTEPKIKAYLSVRADDREKAKAIENSMAQELAGLIS